VSGNPIDDVAQVREVRRAFPSLELIVDAESVYDPRQAIQVGRALDGLDVAWFEAPLPDRDIDGYSRLSQALDTPIVPAGGLIDDPRELARALEGKPWAAVRTQTYEGGIGHVVEFAALARAFNIDLQLCSYGTTVTQAIDLQVMLGLGIGGYYEQAFPIEPWEFGTTTPIVVKDGKVQAPSGPGLGMTLDMEAIERATLARFSLTA
jgi:L-alanine-DL-glutamate epimerase-like enolase superfamily enzyme